MEVKKIKAKLQMTSLIALASILLIVSMVQVAEALPTLTISGSDTESEIFIANNGINNIIILQSDTGVSEHFDSEVKTYRSGGFSMKNPESGILIFGHLNKDAQYKLLVLTSDEVYRFIGIPGELPELVEKSIDEQPSVVPESNNTRIEPQSSVGADVTKYDIPTTGRDGGTQSFLMSFKPSTIHDSMNLNDEYELRGYVYNVRTAERITDADLTLEISRDGYVLDTLKQPIERFGIVDIEIDDMIYPIYYPEFCYDVKLTIEFGNNTEVWEDDFVMKYPSFPRIWEPNMDWVIDARWNYLPQSFRDEPRQSIIEDERCN